MEEYKENTLVEESHTEFIANTTNEGKKQCATTKGSCNTIHWIVEGVLLLAVIALFILHFTCSKSKCDKASCNMESALPLNVSTKPGNGNILYLNLDTIYESDYFKEKQAVLDAEASKLESVFVNRQSKLEADYTQFQKNVQAGVLTETQMQYTYQQLETESNKIREDYQSEMESLAKKQTDLTNEMLDALRDAASRVNGAVEGDPASYVITYSSSNPTVVVVDPSRDITRQVVIEMNKKCTKKSGKE